jgi:Fe-S oxidoreductase
MFPAYEGVPAYPLVFPLLYGAIAYFALAMARHLRVFAVAQRSASIGSLPLRVGGLLVYVFAQVKLFKDLRPGLMHAAIFWGFLVLTIGTADIATGGIVQAVVRWPFEGALWAVVAFLQNAFAVLVIFGVAYAYWRRMVSRPRRLTMSRGALLILGMIGGVVVTELLAMAFEAAELGDIAGALVSNALAGPLRSLSPGLIEGAFAVSWWLHIGLVAAFLVYLPGSKHLHIATSFPNVYLRKLAPRGQLPAMDLEREDAAFGVRTIADLSSKDLLDGFSCTECGRCQDACPAFATGKVLNPKELIMGIRHMAVEAERGLPLIPNWPLFHRADRRPDKVSPERVASPIVGDAISYEAVWDCVTCGACVEACPLLIEHVDKIVGLRRNMVLEDARFPSELGLAFRNMEQAGNPWGEPRSARLEWTKGLDFPVPTVAALAGDGRLAELEVLYWVGCAAAFDERNRKVARAVASCLNAAGVRFAVLGQEESCCGDPARRMGNEYLAQILATDNVETLNRYGLTDRTIVTACPHCLNALSIEFRQAGAQLSVVHHSVYLRRLLEEGRLQPAASNGYAGPARTVTLHDSCYLARYNGIVREPREILNVLPGVELREMGKSGRDTFCCGAGGGRMWMEEKTGTRINVERTRQAVATGAEAVVTECPYCMVMIRDGLNESAEATRMATIDLAELLSGSLVGRRASGAAPSPPEQAVH